MKHLMISTQTLSTQIKRSVFETKTKGSIKSVKNSNSLRIIDFGVDIFYLPMIGRTTDLNQGKQNFFLQLFN